MAKDDSPIRGRWCDRCNGRGMMWGPLRGCPDCNYVGFVGVTSEQVREAELLVSKEGRNGR